MKTNNRVPAAVRQAFSSLAPMGGEVVYLGRRGDKKYYRFEFSEECEVGFPAIVEYSNGVAVRLDGRDALRVNSSFYPED